MAFDAAARTLSGTPGEAQAATTYTCTATDEDGDEATQTVSVAVVVGGLTQPEGLTQCGIVRHLLALVRLVIAGMDSAGGIDVRGVST